MLLEGGQRKKYKKSDKLCLKLVQVQAFKQEKIKWNKDGDTKVLKHLWEKLRLEIIKKQMASLIRQSESIDRILKIPGVKEMTGSNTLTNARKHKKQHYLNWAILSKD